MAEPNITEEVHFEMLEKKADGSFKAKYPKIKSKSGVTFDEHLAENAILIPKSGSTANAILLDIVLTDKKKGSFRASADNTGNMTINGKAFKKDISTQLAAGKIKSGKVYDFYYDLAADSVFILAKASGTAVAEDVLAGKTFSNDDSTDLVGMYVPILPKLAAGEGLIYSDTVEKKTSSTNYVKVAEVKILSAGIIRVKFSLSNEVGYTTYGRVYKNGVAIGAERSVRSSAYTIFTEDFTVSKNDLIQIYIKSTQYNARVNLFSVGIDVSTIVTKIL